MMFVPFALAWFGCNHWLAGDLEDLLRWHQASLEAIRSVRCHVDVSWQNLKTKIPSPPQSGEFWKHGNDLKVLLNRPRGKETFVHKDGRVLVTGASATAVSLDIRTEQDSHSFCHVHRYAGLVLNYPMGWEWYSLAELVSQAKRVHKVRHEGDLAIIELDLQDRIPSGPLWRTRIKLNKSLGCMVTEVTDEGAAPEPGYRQLKMLEFVEFPGGVHFPTLLEGRIVVNGKVNTITTMRLSNVRINEPIPASEFAVDLPHGAWVYDNIRGTRY